MNVVGMGIFEADVQRHYEVLLEYKFIGSNALGQKKINYDPAGSLTMMYLPWIYQRNDAEFDSWEVEKLEDKWEDMMGWHLKLEDELSPKFTQVSLKKVNLLFFFKIVYDVPEMPESPTKEDLEKEVGPIAFRLTFDKGNNERKPLKGCSVIGKTLGNKRSVFHYCAYSQKPEVKLIQLQARFLNPPKEIEKKYLKFVKPAKKQTLPHEFDGDIDTEGYLEVVITGADEVKPE